MTVVLTALGAALIALAVRDIFGTLFRPRPRGHLGTVVARLVWRVARAGDRRRPGLFVFAGPSVLLLTIVLWVGLVVAGFALVYWPRIPEDLLVATGLDPARQGGFTDALYLSLTTVSTLGYGDLTPQSTLLRLLAPFQALIGFGLVTAAISWVLSVTPAVAGLRKVAEEVAVIDAARSRTDISPLEVDGAAALLDEMAERVVSVHEDFLRLPTIYYFQSGDDARSLPAALESLERLMEEGQAADDPGVRVSATRLDVALERLSDTIGTRYLRRPSARRHEVIEAWAADHRHEHRGALRR